MNLNTNYSHRFISYNSAYLTQLLTPVHFYFILKSLQDNYIKLSLYAIGLVWHIELHNTSEFHS